MSGGMAMIKITNLVKRYGDLVALDHLNLEIKEGEIYGLLGFMVLEKQHIAE